MNRLAIACLSSVVLAAWISQIQLAAADSWIEVKSAHFTLWSNASEGATRTLAWQLEQIRSAVTTLWPWARVDLSKPLLVLSVKDEVSMKALAPRYWEQKGAVRPASVWVSGRDQHYLAIRTDVRTQDTDVLNPYLTAYNSYLTLVLQASFDRDLPLWFSHGLAGVLSNTLIRDNHIRLGVPISWHLHYLQDRTRMPLTKLVAVNRLSPEYTQATLRARFEAQSWAFVHFLLFGDQGARRSRFDQFMSLLKSGKDASVALQEGLGRLEDYEEPFVIYVNRSLFSYARINVDASVRREGFAVRPVSAPEAALGRASFHAAMHRLTEARALIAEARKIDSALAAAYVVEGLVFDAENNFQGAGTAFTKAVELGAPSAYAHYRWAQLNVGLQPDEAALAGIDKALTRAVELDSSFANAHSFLAQTRSALGRPVDETVPLVRRAIALEPSEPYHRLVAARIYLRARSYVAAQGEARAALAMQPTESQRREAEELLTSIERMQKGVPK